VGNATELESIAITVIIVVKNNPKSARIELGNKLNLGMEDATNEQSPSWTNLDRFSSDGSFDQATNWQ
jgi:hypothetical protein